MFVDRHVKCGLGVDGSIVCAKYRYALSEFGVVGKLPGVRTGGIAQRLGFAVAVGVLVVTDTRTEFKTQAMYRTIEELTTITGCEDITLTIAVVAIGEPACLAKNVVNVGHVITRTTAHCIFF